MPVEAPGRPRIAWIDASRGLAVLLIVLFHVVVFLFTPYSKGAEVTAWLEISKFIQPFRLATLFLISGMLLSTRIRAGVGDPRTSRSIFTSVYLYVIWYAVYVIARTLGLATGVPPVWFERDLLLLFFTPKSALWFLLALAFWTLLLALLRRVPAWIMLPLLFAGSVLSAKIPHIIFPSPNSLGEDQVATIFAYGVVFGLGVYLRDAIVGGVTRHDWRLAVAALVGFIATNVVQSEFGPLTTLGNGAANAIERASSALLLMLVVAIACRLPWIAKPLSAVGQRTLPIYITHVLVIVMIVKIPTWPLVVSQTVWMQYIGPLLITAVVSLVCVAIETRAQKSRYLKYLFTPPSLSALKGRRASGS